MSANGAEPLRAAVVNTFAERFGEAPAFLARAPGRVNLIGEHTDYNDGFVLPMAIDRAVWIAFRKRPDRTVLLYSLDFDARQQFDLDDRGCSSTGWMKYVHGVALALQDQGVVAGFEGVIAGDVPIGAGLSSSAAIELAAARAFTALSRIPWDARAMALAAQRAENVWVGVNCGIMDQMISAAGKTGHALLIDCRSLTMRQVPMPEGTVVVVLDTGTRRGLVDSAYNDRRMHCEAAAGFLGVPALRDVDVATFEAKSAGMSETMQMRARHVVTENERTLQAADALVNGDVRGLGKLMNASHQSLRDDFEVSNGELDGIVEIARRQPGCYGARMTGAGFGGCAVALVDNETAAQFVAAVAQEYAREFKLQPAIYVCHAAQGASIEQIAAGHEPDARVLPA